MGMFDNLRCEYQLPGLKDSTSIEFQTKSFDSLLDDYKITADGLLMIEEYDIEDRSDPNAVGILKMAGCLTRIPLSWKPIDFTGVVNFYGDKNSGSIFLISFSPPKTSKLDENGNEVEIEPAEWFEYNATFEQGKLTSINRIGERRGSERHTST